MKMWIDPVVNEIHEIRQKMIIETNGDLDALMAKFCAHQNSQTGMLIGKRLPALATDSESVTSTKDAIFK
jgi:hypothetical protein